jgi:hypothetical protein
VQQGESGAGDDGYYRTIAIRQPIPFLPSGGLAAPNVGPSAHDRATIFGLRAPGTALPEVEECESRHHRATFGPHRTNIATTYHAPAAKAERRQSRCDPMKLPDQAA